MGIVDRFRGGPSDAQVRLDAYLDADPTDWLHEIPDPKPGEPELSDVEVAEYLPFMREVVKETIRQVRDGEIEGPVNLMPDSGLPVPSDFLAVTDLDRLEDTARRREAEQPEREKDPAKLLPNEITMLERTPAGLALLECLERPVPEDEFDDVEDLGPEVEAVFERRAREMGVPGIHKWPAEGTIVDYPFKSRKQGS